jgi:hypothetical protein
VPPDALRAVLVENILEFLTRIGDAIATAKPCDYDEATGLVDCTEAGLEAIVLDPPVSGTGVECRAILVNDDLIGVSCNSQEPAFASIYEIAE